MAPRQLPPMQQPRILHQDSIDLTAGAREAQNVMSPHLDAMRKEISENWPEMDPELMLLHWLCVRHQLEPPKVSLTRKPGQMLPSLPGPEPQQPESPPPVASSPPRPGRTLAVEPESPRGELPGKPAQLNITTSFTSGCGQEGCDCQFESPTSWAGEDRDRDLPIEVHLSPCLRSRLRQRREENKKPKIKALAAITSQVQTDVMNLNEQQGQFSRNLDAIATHVATMRQELRGKFVGNVPLLSLKVLSVQEQFWLVGKLRPWNFEEGDTIFAEGESGDKLYIIERGFCEIWKDVHGTNTRICRIQKGDFFGELAVMYDMPRSATVKAVTGITLLSLSRDDLYKTLPEDKIQHMKVLARAQVFSSVPLLSKLDTQTKVLIAGRLRVDVWEPGESILRENAHVGGPTQRLYLIEKGQCVISNLKDSFEPKKGGKVPQEDRRLSKTLFRKHSVFCSSERRCQAGSYFGMLEFLYGCPQMVSLRAAPENQVITLSISQDEIRDLFLEHSLDFYANRKLMKQAVRSHLVQEAHPLLKTLSTDELESILSAAQTRWYGQWAPIFKKDDELHSLSILEEGNCIAYDGNAEALLECHDKSVECTEYDRPGETFGTKQVIGKTHPVAEFTVVATSKCKILHISTKSLANYPKLFVGQEDVCAC